MITNEGGTQSNVPKKERGTFNRKFYKLLEEIKDASNCALGLPKYCFLMFLPYFFTLLSFRFPLSEKSVEL